MTSEKIVKVEDLVSNNPHISIKNLANETGISREKMSYILHSELSLHRRKERITVRDVMLHHDNAATHKATIMTEYLHNERVELFPHLPCSPDRAPCNSLE